MSAACIAASVFAVFPRLLSGVAHAQEPPTGIPAPADTSGKTAAASSEKPKKEKEPRLPGRAAADFASTHGNIAYLALGVGLPLLRDGGYGQSHTIRAFDSVATTSLLAECLKLLTHEERPDGKDHLSFPSGHTTAAFAVASAESAFHPREAPLWIAGAALIGSSRISLRRHHLKDVLAGALIGWLGTRAELSSSRGYLAAPFTKRDESGRLSLSLRF